MTSYINFAKLAALLRAKRDSKGLREVAEEIGNVSPSTLSRIEGERVDDIASSTLLSLCDWLGISPADVIEEIKVATPPAIALVDSVDLQLRADRDLDPTMAKMLSEMFKAAYREAKKNPTTKQ